MVTLPFKILFPPGSTDLSPMAHQPAPPSLALPENGSVRAEPESLLGVCAAETSAPDVPQYVVGLRIPNYHILYLVVLKGGQIGSRAQAPRASS